MAVPPKGGAGLRWVGVIHPPATNLKHDHDIHPAMRVAWRVGSWLLSGRSGAHYRSSTRTFRFSTLRTLFESPSCRVRVGAMTRNAPPRALQEHRPQLQIQFRLIFKLVPLCNTEIPTVEGFFAWHVEFGCFHFGPHHLTGSSLFPAECAKTPRAPPFGNLSVLT